MYVPCGTHAVIIENERGFLSVDVLRTVTLRSRYMCRMSSAAKTVDISNKAKKCQAFSAGTVESTHVAEICICPGFLDSNNYQNSLNLSGTLSNYTFFFSQV